MEIDADDAISWHWIIYASKADGTDVPAATIRLVPARKHVAAEPVERFEEPDYAGSTAWDQREPYVVIGRVATVEGCRKRGFAGGLMREVLGFAGRNAGGVVRDGELGVWKGLVLVHAQRVLEGWYGGMGFVTDGGMGTWLEAGIEHVAMWKRVEVGGEGGR